jgi:epoxyqueuosine reductase
MNSSCCDTRQIKAEAMRLGFSACGFSPAAPPAEPAAAAFRSWIAEGSHAGMTYMANHADKRLDPRQLVEGTRTIISLALNYYPAHQLRPDQYQFAWYAYGRDYHDVMKSKLRQLEEYIRSHSAEPMESRIFCDTAPVMERYWAWRGGLGWQGKNTQLILPHAGSTHFLGEIFISLPASEYDSPMPNRCGECRRCLDACPTGALEAPYSLNARRCLSYLTIEHRDAIPPAEAKRMGNKVYGCDECQRACPWNRFAQPCATPEFQPSAEFMSMTRRQWEQLSEDDYRRLFKGSAVKRAKFSGLVRNINAAKGNEEGKKGKEG